MSPRKAWRVVLVEHTGVIEDPFSVTKLFASRNQLGQEKVVDYADELK